MAKEKQKKKINISEMNFSEIVNLLANNPEANITAAVLFVTIREFEKRMIQVYGLEDKTVVKEKPVTKKK